MSKPNKFVIIDEKPKRGHETRRWSPSRTFLTLMGLMTLTFIFGCLFLYMESIAEPCCMISDLELTATAIVRQNATVAAYIRQTDHPRLTVTPTPTLTETAEETQVFIQLSDVQQTACPLIRITEAFPLLTTIAQNAVDVAGLMDITIDAQSSGLPHTPECERFSPQGHITTFNITISTQDFGNAEIMINLLSRTVDALNGISSEEERMTVRRSVHDELDVTFVGTTNTTILQTTMGIFAAARARGLTGGALWEAVDGVP